MFASQAELRSPPVLKAARQLHRAAWWSLVKSRLRLTILGFARVYPRLGKLKAESPETIPEDCEKLVTGIAQAIDRMRWYLPWKNNCLVSAVAAHRMLAQIGIHHTLYIGMAKSADGTFEVHAWLRCGSQIVTGGGRIEQYAVVACFAWEGRESGTAFRDDHARGIKDIALADFRT